MSGLFHDLYLKNLTLFKGQIPTGYASEVKDHSDKYHRIPWDFVRGENKYDTIYRDIRDFLKGVRSSIIFKILIAVFYTLFFQIKCKCL